MGNFLSKKAATLLATIREIELAETELASRRAISLLWCLPLSDVATGTRRLQVLERTGSHHDLSHEGGREDPRTRVSPLGASSGGAVAASWSPPRSRICNRRRRRGSL